jgi:hypothetical protein
VLDLGAGAGIWRELADAHTIGSLKPWIAVEAHRPYVNRFRLRHRYDGVRIRDLLSLKYSAYPGFLFIFGDVLEHLDREDAVQAIWRASSVGTAVVMMPFAPTTSAEQDGDGVESERHRYVWTWEEWLGVLTTLSLDVEPLEVPPGAGRNKGITICWHQSHR